MANPIDVETFRKTQLEKLNVYRAKHGSKPLENSDELNEYAQAWADHMASRNSLSHHVDCPFGEAVFAGSIYSYKDVVDAWYEERQKYNFDAPEENFNTKHFSQIVWRDSKECGFGIAKTARGMVFVVANFNPPGNVKGHFAENVYPEGTVQAPTIVIPENGSEP
ncbi:hypothetical protein AAVH_22881 [Aphelenchoides avenae]|nr:hypothetical protein AAVH_22881 [Aphelenchus avenae]